MWSQGLSQLANDVSVEFSDSWLASSGVERCVNGCSEKNGRRKEGGFLGVGIQLRPARLLLGLAILNECAGDDTVVRQCADQKQNKTLTMSREVWL